MPGAAAGEINQAHATVLAGRSLNDRDLLSDRQDHAEGDQRQIAVQEHRPIDRRHTAELFDHPLGFRSGTRCEAGCRTRVLRTGGTGVGRRVHPQLARW